MTLERMTGLLRRAGVCSHCGSRKEVLNGECLACIVEQDKRLNWPRIEEEKRENHHRK